MLLVCWMIGVRLFNFHLSSIIFFFLSIEKEESLRISKTLVLADFTLLGRHLIHLTPLATIIPALFLLPRTS